MFFFRNYHLDLTTSRLETLRCVLVPFSTDGTVDIRELREEFCRANRFFYVSPSLPSYEEEVEYIRKAEEKIARGEEFENFILEKGTDRLIGCAGLRMLATEEVNIGIWIREDEQGKGYASEAYEALIDWARVHTTARYLVHSLDPTNTGSRKLAEKYGGVLQGEKNEREYDIYHIPL